MEDLHQIFDSTIGFLAGMTLMEVILKPLLVRWGKRTLEIVNDGSVQGDSVIPDWLFEERESESE
jgi:hypothetical protein